MNDRSIDLPRDITTRRHTASDADKLLRGLDRGVVTTLPIEALLVGTDMLLAAVDVGHLPFVLKGLAAQAVDEALGTLTIAMYRVDVDDVLPTRFTARLSGSVDVVVGDTSQEYMGVLGVEKEIDRVAAAWLVGVLGSTSTMQVRGTESYTVPSLAGWSVAAPGDPPATLDSRNLAWSLKVPSVALLTQAGTRMRGTGIIG